MITVTKPYLPNQAAYLKRLKTIWENQWLTNNGPMVQELEEKLKAYLGVKHLFLLNNGTIALQIAIKALELKGEIITTPFSYVATTSSIVWENCTPVYVDIEEDTCTMDAGKIEGAITANTTAIMATHVYGNPCKVEQIEALAKKHGLKVIYDAAHAFGVQYKGQSVLNYGDISTLSFHATKLFHTVEGGAAVTNSDEVAERIMFMRNFGHNGPAEFWGCGINGKNSEMHAAMGLTMLPDMDKILAHRALLSDTYIKELQNTSLRFLNILEGTTYNHAYIPVFFSTEEKLLQTKQHLEDNEVFTRRYFYPSLNNLPYVQQQSCPVSEDVARRVLCLPIYYDLSAAEVKRVTQLIKEKPV